MAFTFGQLHERAVDLWYGWLYCYRMRFLSHSSISYRSAILPGWLFALTLLLPFSVLANNTFSLQEALQNELHKQLTVPRSEKDQVGINRSRLMSFYEPRQFKPVWLDEKGPLPEAAILRQVLNDVERQGLEFHVYHPDKITALWKKRLPWTLAELEILLSDAVLKYIEHVQTGYRTPHIGEYFWDMAQSEIDTVKILHSLLQADDFRAALTALAPQQEGYQRLREALQKYRNLKMKGGWPVIADGPALHLGQWHDQVPILRQRLLAEGDLELGPVTHPRYFDQAVKFAVERFQVRYGLAMDGVVGAGTRKAMNTSIDERIEQIKLNMERWRWLPRELGERYVMVNTAGYELAVVENNKTRLTMDVMVGTPNRPTPIVTGRLHTVVLNPYWTLPPTIIFEDVLPRQLRDKSYMKRKGIRVFANGKELNPAAINWRDVEPDHFPYILRQDPGTKNPLGRLKFLFSNSYDVYLHDTPSQRLFYKDNRAFSSGCVRVAKPVKLASYLLGEKNGWSMASLEKLIDSGEYQQIPVNARVPVYLVYMTAWVGENKGVHFRPDVYKWDPNVSKCDTSR